jgi:xanthine dehydrogenase accessory factor
MNAWLHALDRVTRDGASAVLVTVAAGKGSVPRAAGTKMLVWADGFAGTIGGGHLEFQAIDIARHMLGASRLDLRRFPLGASLGQCCGGAVTLLFEPVAGRPEWIDTLLDCERTATPWVVATPERGGAKMVVTPTQATGSGPDAVVAMARRRLGEEEARMSECEGTRWLLDPSPQPSLHVVLFGAGHVGRAIARVLGTLPCSVTWVDGRDGEFPDDVPPNVRVEATDTPLAEVAAAPADACFLVMTHSHALDFDLGEAILARGDFRFFGLIGSRTKRRSFEQRLERRGLDAEALARMTCPIGVPGIAGKEPEVIAVAVAAQLLQLRAAEASAAVPAQQAGAR